MTKPLKRPNHENYIIASSPGEVMMHPATRAAPPPRVSDPVGADHRLGTLADGIDTPSARSAVPPQRRSMPRAAAGAASTTGCWRPSGASSI
jgi:hypothetical protein